MARESKEEKLEKGGGRGRDTQQYLSINGSNASLVFGYESTSTSSMYSRNSSTTKSAHMS